MNPRLLHLTANRDQALKCVFAWLYPLLRFLLLPTSVNMSVGPEIQKRIAEDIALLHYLGDFPCVALPTPHQPQTASEGYALSLDHELELASDLAFLSSIRSDKSNITAVAIHQTDQDGLRVLLAANATFRGSDQAYLEQVRSGLVDITQVMGKAASCEC